jgi:hypothetical protein
MAANKFCRDASYYHIDENYGGKHDAGMRQLVAGLEKTIPRRRLSFRDCPSELHFRQFSMSQKSGTVKYKIEIKPAAVRGGACGLSQSVSHCHH